MRVISYLIRESCNSTGNPKCRDYTEPGWVGLEFSARMEGAQEKGQQGG